MRLGGRAIAELAGKSTIETCMNLILISLAMVRKFSIKKICNLFAIIVKNLNAVHVYQSFLIMAASIFFLWVVLVRPF